MLIDRRTSFVGEPGSCSGLIDDARSVGTSGVEFVLRVPGERGGLISLDGVRRVSFDGVWDIDANRDVVEDAGRPKGLLRVFAMGKVGSAEVGGGTDASGILIVAMLRVRME